MEKVTFVIMDNLIGQDFMNIKRIYDLKGSTLGRRTKLTEKEKKEETGLKVLKDLDFLEIQEKFNV